MFGKLISRAFAPGLVAVVLLSAWMQIANGAVTVPPCSRSAVSVPVSPMPHGREDALIIPGPDLPAGRYIAWMNWNGTWYASTPKNLTAGYKYLAHACTSENCYYKVFWNDQAAPSVGGSSVKTEFINYNMYEGCAADVTMTICQEDETSLQIDLSIVDGEVFTQGDDLPIVAQVTRDKEPVAGAAVSLKLVSPGGTEYAQSEEVTNFNGMADWKCWFTACAAVGNWQVVAQAITSSEQGEITRTITLEKLTVSSAQVQANITKIAQEWLSHGQPDGIRKPFIRSLRWPRGFKVNLKEWVDSRYKPFTCSEQAFETLKFLNTIRFSVQKERRLWMAGVDYGPISDGTSVIHVAVGLYANGSDWLSGYVLEPWFNQKKEVWNANTWSLAFGANPVLDWRLRNPWSGEYPTTGSDGGYYPHDAPPILTSPHKTRVLSYSPAFLIVADEFERRVGRLPDGSVVNEIPGSEQCHTNNDDGTYINFISVPDGDYEVRITGTDNGTFHLATGTDTGVVNYGEQPIQFGKQATLALKSADLQQPLMLSDESLVQPEPGFYEQARCAAAYLLGADDPRLDQLRQYRDEQLATTGAGALLIAVYYSRCGNIIELCEKNPLIKKYLTGLLEAAIPVLRSRL